MWDVGNACSFPVSELLTAWLTVVHYFAFHFFYFSDCGRKYMPDGRLCADVSKSTSDPTLYQEDEDDDEHSLKPNAPVLVADGEKGICSGRDIGERFQCSRHFLKRFSGHDMQIIQRIIRATSKAKADALLALQIVDDKGEPLGLSKKAQKKIKNIPKNEWIPAYGPLATMHASTNSNAESAMKMLKADFAGIRGVRLANDFKTALQRSMFFLETNYLKTCRHIERDVQQNPGEILVPWIRTKYAEITSQAQAKPMSLLSENRSPGGKKKATLKRYNSHRTVTVVIDPCDTFEQRGENGAHQAHSNLHFDGQCSLHCPSTLPAKVPCKCLMWYIHYLGLDPERLASYTDTRLNAVRALAHSGRGQDLEEGQDSFMEESEIMNDPVVPDDMDTTVKLTHTPFSVPAIGRPLNSKRHEHWTNKCSPRVPPPKQKRNRDDDDDDDDDELLNEAQMTAQAQAQAQAQVNDLIDNNILNVLEGVTGYGRMRSDDLFQEVETKVVSVLTNIQRVMPYEGRSSIVLRCEHLANVHKIFKFGPKYQFNQEFAGGGSGSSN